MEKKIDNIKETNNENNGNLYESSKENVEQLIFDYSIVEKFKDGEYKKNLKQYKEMKKDLIISIFLFVLIVILGVYILNNETKIIKNKIDSNKNEITNTNEVNNNIINSNFTTYPIREMLYIGKNNTNIILFDVEKEEIVTSVYTLKETNEETLNKAKKLFEEDIVVGSIIYCGGFENTGTYHIVDIDMDNIQLPMPYKYSLKTLDRLNDDDVYNSSDWLYIHSSQTNYKGDKNTNIERKELWDSFVEKTKNKEKSFIKIADNTNDGLILTILFFDGDNYFVIEDDSRIFENNESETINNNIYYFEEKEFLEELTIKDITLWYLTNQEGIGPKLLEDGTLSSIISGNFNLSSLENEIDMFWLWTDTSSYINNLLASDKEIWKGEYKEIFPYVYVEWETLGEEGTSFVIGEGENAISGTTGGKDGELKKEELNIASATIYKEKEPLNLKNDCNLVGLHTLQVDLSSMIAICEANSDITINVSTEHLKNKGIPLDNTIVRLKLWNGVYVGQVNANPSYIDEMIGDSITFSVGQGLTFGEISFESEYGTCSWNFVVNGK